MRPSSASLALACRCVSRCATPRRAVQPRARRQRRLHRLARLRPDPPAHRGAELRLGLDRVRRPRHHDAGLAPAGARCRRARHGPHARGPERDARRAHVPAPPAARSRSPDRATRWWSACLGPRPSATRSGSPWTITAASGRATGSTSSRPTAGLTARSRCTAAAAPTATRAGCRPGPARRTRRRGSWSATVPSKLVVVSNGRLVSDRPAPGGMHTVTWRQEKPASTYLISLAAAPFARISRPLARHSGRLLRLPRGQRSRAAAVRRDART